MISDLEQLHEMEKNLTLGANKLTKKYRAEAIESLMLLTEKMYGRIKGITCSDGRIKWSYIKIEDTVSPTVSLEAITITSTIETHETVTCLEFASRIGFDRKVSCLTYFYLTRFPTAKVSFKLYLKLVRDILTSMHKSSTLYT